MIRFNNVEVVREGRCLLQIDQLELNGPSRVVVLGRNGAGKSTLLRLINGFVLPTVGSVQVGDVLVSANSSAAELRSLRASVGLIWQGLHLVGRLSVLDNVVAGALPRMGWWHSVCRLFDDQTLAQAHRALESVGMLHLMHQRADQLSGGERQKVAIARALMQHALWILADEPTAALDPVASFEICEILAKQAKKSGLISVVHQPELVPVLADRVIGIRAGRVVVDCPVQAFTADVQEFLYSE